MNIDIEWWMLDGIAGLIILVCALRGGARGIGDSILRLLGFAGSVVLGVFFSDRATAYLSETRFRDTLRDNIYQVVRRSLGAGAAEETEQTNENIITQIFAPRQDPYSESMPKSLGGLVGDLADKTADAAAGRLTELALNVMGFVLVMLAVWVLITVLRLVLRSLRKSSKVIGFLDRVMGFVLGTIRGLLIVCVAAAVLIPVTTWLAPARVPEMLDALNKTYVTGVLYDVNPILLVMKYFVLK